MKVWLKVGVVFSREFSERMRNLNFFSSIYTRTIVSVFRKSQSKLSEISCTNQNLCTKRFDFQSPMKPKQDFVLISFPVH